ncbi:MAG: ArnT family glycosyltransferase, partial [Acidobacteriota bacterium]
GLSVGSDHLHGPQWLPPASTNARMMGTQARQALPVLAVGAVSVLAVTDLSNLPAPWWDEGWTLSVARNWAELGHYGLLLRGERVSDLLAAHLPVVAPIALSFKLFGVGIIQARAVGVVFTLSTLLLMFVLARRLFDARVAWLTIALLLLCPIRWQMHPLILGRQVLGELPMLFFLVAGYCAFLRTRERLVPFASLAAVCWSLALMTKLQTLPFWLVSMAVAIALAAVDRRWHDVRVAGGVLVGSLAVFQLLESGRIFWQDDATWPANPMTGASQVLGLVTDGRRRLEVLQNVLTFCLPTLMGVLYGSARWVAARRPGVATDVEQTVRWMLAGLVASWLVWYGALSIGWERYVIPAVFMGAPLTAALLREWTSGTGRPPSVAEPTPPERARATVVTSRRIAAVALSVLLVVPAVRSVQLFLETGREAPIEAVVDFLHGYTPPGAVIETDEAQLFFLLDRPYHFPPAQLSVDLVRREWLDPNAPVAYDPLGDDPDFLVIGPRGKQTRIYDAAVQAGWFQHVGAMGSYDLFARRPGPSALFTARRVGQRANSRAPRPFVPSSGYP